MKSLLLTLTFLLTQSFAVTAQTVSNDDVVRLQHSSKPYRQGQLLVKFKDNSKISVRRARGLQYPDNSSNSVGQLVQQLGISSMEQLMPNGGKLLAKSSRRLLSVTGKQLEDKDLTRLYLVNFDSHHRTDVMKAVEAFSKLDDVEFAEPNYMIYALGSPVLAGGQISSSPKKAGQLTNLTNPNDPLYSEQWGPAAINLPQLWGAAAQNVLGRRPVIAILDTGVDIDHPDLKDNIWTNEQERDGVEGADDDNNGYTDDLHGWDCVNQTGRLGDYNGHGTHCAGIAAGVANNGIGIAGANPDALIMPVTVLQSDGGGDVGTIIRGLEYAMTHDVDVISMSIGGYGYSMAEELALGKAYHYSVIVGAAGNDGGCINLGHPISTGPMFPGAFTFVMGVEASKSWPGYPYPVCGKGIFPYNDRPWRAFFTNFDDDGPIYSGYDEEKIYNYELMAPGVDIMSTYPHGRYILMNGTSMATPLVAGAVSRLLQTKEYSSKELLFGDLIATANEESGVLDVMAAYNVTDADRHPTLMLVGIALSDSVGGDGDGRFDAGEIIELYPIMRNTWGEAVGIRCSLTTSDNEDTEIIDIIENDVDFGHTLHSYGKERSLNPIRFKINENCVDGRRIRLTVNSTCENGTGETIAKDIIITVENGEELEGIMQKNTTLDASKHYIVTKSFAIPAGLTLSIPPGTTIKFHDYALLKVSPSGRIRAIGTPDKPIIFTKGDLSLGYVPTMEFNNNCVFKYCRFEMLSAAENLIGGGQFTDCVFKNNDVGAHGLIGMTTTRCNIMENTGYVGIEYGNTHTNSNIIDNKPTHLTFECYCQRPWYEFLPSWNDYKGCNIYGNYRDYLHHSASVATITLEPTVIYSDYPSYLGSSLEDIARQGVIDYYNECNDDVHLTTFGAIDLTNMLKQPNAEAHGVVWKILVDGWDAQDEYDSIPPLGVGTHRVDVYFNRQMDTSVQPWLSMGVRPPYTQTFINENPSWSDDGKIYTAYITITAKSAFDGINRFYVSDAQDLDHFEIPIERTRFHVPVSAAGSMSTGFMAEAGMGQVKLTWDSMPAEEIEDIIGYNLYRYQVDADGQSTDTLRINTQIIEDVQGSEITFTDFDVLPGTTYYYYYRVMRSTLDSTDPSNTVAATPLTAAKGDANGSLDITVTDAIAIVAYLLGQNPQPFIIEAADVNGDGTVNILDLVLTINLALSADLSQQGTQSLPTALYSIEDGVLYLESPVAIAGLQVLLENENGNEVVKAEPVLDGMEQVSAPTANGLATQFLAYSMSGHSIASGRYALLRIGDAKVTGMVLSDAAGRQVLAADAVATAISEMPAVEPIIQVGIYDLQGRRIVNRQSSNRQLQRGVYIINGKKVCF